MLTIWLRRVWEFLHEIIAIFQAMFPGNGSFGRGIWLESKVGYFTAINKENIFQWFEHLKLYNEFDSMYSSPHVKTHMCLWNYYYSIGQYKISISLKFPRLLYSYSFLCAKTYMCKIHTWRVTSPSSHTCMKHSFNPINYYYFK